MSQFFHIHAETPQSRLINQAVAILRQDGVMAYPTDSGYALGCLLGNKEGMERIQQLRHLDKNHHFTLVCRDLSELATYAKVDNQQFRLLKAHTPGAYTFILNGTHEVPRRLLQPKRRTIGIRVPQHPICHALLAALGEPLMSTSLILPGEQGVMTDAEQIRQVFEHRLQLIIDGGFCGDTPTTVVDLSEAVPHILRYGKGDAAPFEI